MKAGMITKVATAVLTFSALLVSVSAENEVNFERDVFGILRKACFECHGDRKQEADLRLDNRSQLLSSGTVVPGSTEDSELFRRVSLRSGHEEIMPAIGEPLSRTEIRNLRRWIESGAEWPADFITGKHWAYVAPERPTLPPTNDDDWSRNPIDGFVLARLQRENMHPSPQALPETLIRRAYFDVIGLPPSPQEVHAFAADPSDAAYENIVDELLQRPQFGERWARPWLDLARYADSHGFQRDDLREIWAYRDWVITALNDDMPFDRFTIEQIAGDLLPDATEAQKIATGFHRCTPTNVEAGSLPDETRLEQVIDRVNTTAAVWLGTTLECAQCHDHKFDPFSAKDYYRLLAYFNNTQAEADRADPKKPSSIAFRGPKMPLSNPAKDARRKSLQDELTALETRRDQLTATLNQTLPEWSRELAETESVPADIAAALKTTPQKWTKQQRRKLLDYRTQNDADTKELTDEISRVKKKLDSVIADTTLVMIELDHPRMAYVFERGDYRNHGETVHAGTPPILHPASDGPPNRLTLARWLVDRGNPLVARVTVNRWWAEIFGQGIVATVEDFGVKGDNPSHPELLDWLALEFMENDWSMKKLLRTILLSATYRQASIVTPELREQDDRNRLLARGPRFRMDAEMIRDNILTASGLISLKQFGPSIRPYQPDGIWSKVGGTAYDYEASPGTEKYRRGLYVVLKRGAPYPSFINFDASARLACIVRRSRSNTPLQALTLLNDPVYVEAADALARRVLTERSSVDVDRKIDYAFQLCTARTPSADERNTLRDLLETQISINTASSPNATTATDLPAGIDESELAAWRTMATTVINLHETITRN